MITLQGTHKFEKCGQEYDWIARKREQGEKVVVGKIDDIINHNVQNIRLYGGHLIVTGHCPYCGMMQRMSLVNNEIEETSNN